MTVASTFQSYLSSLELTDRERADASAQQVALHDRLRLHLAGFVDSRLVGSYRRGTAIRPLKDIDVFVVLNARHHHRTVSEAPLRLLQTIERALRASYPSHQPRIQGRSVNIGFSGTEIDYDIGPPSRRRGRGPPAPNRRTTRSPIAASQPGSAPTPPSTERRASPPTSELAGCSTG